MGASVRVLDFIRLVIVNDSNRAVSFLSLLAVPVRMPAVAAGLVEPKIVDDQDDSVALANREFHFRAVTCERKMAKR